MLRTPAGFGPEDAVRVVQALLDTHDLLRLRVPGGAGAAGADSAGTEPTGTESTDARPLVPPPGSVDARALIEHVEHGLFPPYAEKTRAGVDVFDCRAQPLYGFRYPWRGYARFEDVPPIVPQALLLPLLHLSEPTRPEAISYAVFSLKH